jgi:hypothetical protein
MSRGFGRTRRAIGYDPAVVMMIWVSFLMPSRAARHSMLLQQYSSSVARPARLTRLEVAARLAVQVSTLARASEHRRVVEPGVRRASEPTLEERVKQRATRFSPRSRWSFTEFFGYRDEI